MQNGIGKPLKFNIDPSIRLPYPVADVKYQLCAEYHKAASRCFDLPTPMALRITGATSTRRRPPHTMRTR